MASIRHTKKCLAQLITICIVLLTIILPLTALSPKLAQTAPAHPPVEVKLLAGNFGSSSYIMGFATAKIINKSGHPWLTCNAVETLGSFDKLMMLEKMDPEKRKTTIAFIADSTYYDALAGRKPVPRKFTELRATFRLGSTHQCLVTWDPNIKTPQDLIGKSMATYAKQSGVTERWCYRMMGDVWGILDKVKVQYVGPSAAATAFGDRLVHALNVQFYMLETAKGIELVPLDYWRSIYEMHKEKLYFFGITKADAGIAVQKTGYPYPYIIVPPKTAGPTQTKPLGLASSILGVGIVWKDAPDDVIYEFVKTLVENVDEYKYYLPAERPTRTELAEVYVTSEAEVHPAALRYYKEKGLKVGIEGIIK